MARILVTEEERSLLGLYRTILGGLGYEMIWALKGNQGLELLHSGRGRFVLIILDVEMSEVRTLIHDIHTAFPMIPILNCSANVREGLRLMDQGLCAGSIPKPFELRQFIKAVHETARMDLERRSGEDRRKHERIPDAMTNRRKGERRRPLQPAFSFL